MAKNKVINVKGTEITLFTLGTNDFISLTDIAKHKDTTNSDPIIQNWMRNRNTIELLGFWEVMYNLGFKPLEFEEFRKQAGLNNYKLSIKEWVGNAECNNSLQLL